MEKIIRYISISAFLIAAMFFSIILPRRELGMIAQVSGIAMDYRGGEIISTFEMFVPAVDQPFGKERQTISARGETLEECILNARLSLGKELYVDDISVLIVEDQNREFLLGEIGKYYSRFNRDHMDLPLFITKDQQAASIFGGKGKILSIEIAKSAQLVGRRMTIRDFFNGSENYIYIQGEGEYEIVS